MLSAGKDTLANDAGKPLSGARRDAWDTAANAKDTLQDAAHNAGRTVRGYIDTASEEITQATDTVKTHIRSNPVQSSLVALAAGFILGRLFRL
jgi:ElaB/YqjD/DUF883 family membrane-anchored ribosome-binding protein